MGTACIVQMCMHDEHRLSGHGGGAGGQLRCGGAHAHAPGRPGSTQTTQPEDARRAAPPTTRLKKDRLAIMLPRCYLIVNLVLHLLLLYIQPDVRRNTQLPLPRRYAASAGARGLAFLSTTHTLMCMR